MVALRIDEQHLVAYDLRLVLIKEPQRARKALGVEKVIAHVQHHVHHAGLHELAALGALGVGIGGGTCHNNTCTAVLIQIRVEVVNPQVVGTTRGHLVLLVLLGHAQRKSPGVHGGGPFDLIHVKRRIGCHIVAFAFQRMCVVVESVGRVAALDVALHAVHCHVHKAELGVVVHLFLPVEHHRLSRVAALLARVIAGGHEHAARSACGVEHGSARRLDNVHDHAHERLGREEHTVVACDSGRELAQEVLVDAPDNIVALFVEGGVVKDTDDAC